MRSFKEYLNEKNQDGDSYFDSSAMHLARNPKPYDPTARRSEDPDYCKLIHMHPKDFLSVARNGHDPKKQKVVDDLISSKTKFNDIPEIHFKHNGEGEARVSGHEGRHRARALLAAGVTKMPVRLKQTYNGDIPPVNWRNHFEGVFPHTLREEDGPDDETNHNRNNKIDFPTADPRKKK